MNTTRKAMQRSLALVVGLGLALGGGDVRGADQSPLLVLCYHDIVTSEAAATLDPQSVTVDSLVSQLAWLDAEGYQPIDLATWRAAADGGELPDKPVMLTFDDGYASFHDHVVPLLELFDFPAVLAPVTSWIEAPPGSRVPYGDELVSRDRFMTWEQIRAAVESGLVDIASHTHDLHKGIAGNPFGNVQPAVTTRRYQAEAGTYETDEDYRARLRDDLASSARLLERHAGVRPRTIAWPYGAYNATASEIARDLDLPLAMTLEPTANDPATASLHRRLIGSDMTLDNFVMLVRGHYRPRPLRAAHVDMDYLYDPDPAQRDRNLDRLLDRIRAAGINRVFLQAFADPDGNGVADALYFPNRHLPLRADLFNRVAWQLRTRANVQVFAWMPVLAFELPDAATNRRLAVLAADGSHDQRYHRLSPFHPEARRLIAEIYDDLGRSSHFAGVLYHDDAFLAEREDHNPAAAAFNARHGADDAAALARAKTLHLIELTDELSDVLRRHEPALVTARNLYARLVTEPASEAWFAQHLGLFLEHYDYTALMAMPYLEQARRPRRWLERLVAPLAGTAGRPGRRPARGAGAHGLRAADPRLAHRQAHPRRHVAPPHRHPARRRRPPSGLVPGRLHQRPPEPRAAALDRVPGRTSGAPGLSAMETLYRLAQEFALIYPLFMAYLWMAGGIYYYFHWERRGRRPVDEPPPLESYPGVSVIVPAHNESFALVETIESLLAQRYPELEIIVVDDGSSDDTAEIMDRYATRGAIRALFLETNQGKAAAMRVATLASRHEYLVCVDGDAILDPHAVHWLVRHFVTGHRVGAVTGNPRVRTRSTLLGRIQVGEFSSIIGLIKRAQRVYGRVFTVSGVVAAFRKSALLRVGFWDVNKLTDDIDISWRLQMDHWSIRFESNALCWILMPETLKGLWRQRLRWARGGAEVIIEHTGDLLSWRKRHMWPVLIEFCVSVLWSYTMLLLGGSLLLAQVLDVPLVPDMREWLPSWGGVLIGLTCLLQFAVSLAIDSRYEKGLARYYYWIIWYPMAYWLINVLTTLVAVPRTLLDRRARRAVWTSPDRGERFVDAGRS